ncbi:SMP-30/gluconolactonase/LRE family protein [Herbiconiux moechotypicola]|uniref:SMP-30/gluconolactonase/LRE family protein n=1 Tax=Herbiconiux moechotypicola TaxID=637393 RepID=A0ABN3D993_9MICO|nr:SMP-30/gluconolactonase/LRE family protein [Herbiconiux moechotypicola]MCS5729128.1 SMP-30/gluconolactonase/LRE family protein [Herbiconiux moechotypicola]
MRAEQLTDPITFHGEGAVWHEAWGGLKLVDMFAGDVLSLAPDGAVTRLHTGSLIAAMVRPRASGGFVVATERAFELFDADGEREWSSGPVIAEGFRMNEGSCDPFGRLLCGSLQYGFADGAGTMYRLGAPGEPVEALFGGLTITNGLGFTGDGSLAFYADTPTRRIDVFDVDARGELTSRRPWVHLPEGVGNPDGLCVDSAGGVWVALYDGSAVHHYDASGALVEVVELPVSRVTSCTLGGPDLRTLYITTSRENLPADAEPEAGALFTTRADTPGLPTLTFAA